MNDLYELFETDDPSQMADRLMQLIREAIEDEGHTEETLEVIKEMVDELTGLVG